MRLLTEFDVLDELVRMCNLYGSGLMARQLGVSQAYLINVRRGRVGIGPKVVAALGFEPVYRRVRPGSRKAT